MRAVGQMSADEVEEGEEEEDEEVAEDRRRGVRLETGRQSGDGLQCGNWSGMKLRTKGVLNR